MKKIFSGILALTLTLTAPTCALIPKIVSNNPAKSLGALAAVALAVKLATAQALSDMNVVSSTANTAVVSGENAAARAGDALSKAGDAVAKRVSEVGSAVAKRTTEAYDKVAGAAATGAEKVRDTANAATEEVRDVMAKNQTVSFMVLGKKLTLTKSTLEKMHRWAKDTLIVCAAVAAVMGYCKVREAREKSLTERTTAARQAVVSRGGGFVGDLRTWPDMFFLVPRAR